MTITREEAVESLNRLFYRIDEMRNHCQRLAEGFDKNGDERLKNEYLEMIRYIEYNLSSNVPLPIT